LQRPATGAGAVSCLEAGDPQAEINSAVMDAAMAARDAGIGKRMMIFRAVGVEFSITQKLDS